MSGFEGRFQRRKLRSLRRRQQQRPATGEGSCRSSEIAIETVNAGQALLSAEEAIRHVLRHPSQPQPQQQHRHQHNHSQRQRRHSREEDDDMIMEPISRSEEEEEDCDGDVDEEEQEAEVSDVIKAAQRAALEWLSRAQPQLSDCEGLAEQLVNVQQQMMEAEIAAQHAEKAAEIAHRAAERAATQRTAHSHSHKAHFGALAAVGIVDGAAATEAALAMGEMMDDDDDDDGDGARRRRV